MKNLEACISKWFAEHKVTSLAIRIGRGDEILWEHFQSNERELTDQTLFDMASVTKMAATTSLTLIALDRGMLHLDTPVSQFWPVPEDKKNLKIFHLLTHTLGFGHQKLFEPDVEYGLVQELILSYPCLSEPGTEVRYSCPGFILLGRIVETVFGMRLDAAFEQYVAKPLGMVSSTFHPDPAQTINSNRTPESRGLVNDYNSRFLGGVCGNAGLFSNMADMTRFVQMMIAHGAPLMSREIFDLAAQNYTAGMAESRGLGFVYVDGRYFQTGGLFPEGSIGHCGHTGQSVFVDPQSGFYVIILSDATIQTVHRYGPESKHYQRVVEMRNEIHNAIRMDLCK